MSDIADAINVAVPQLMDAVAESLRTQGWIRMDVDFPEALVLTRTTGGGFCATAELRRASFRWPAAWPVELNLAFGVGYEPATALMPILTLSPVATLLDEASPEAESTLELSGPDTVAPMATKIVELIKGHDPGFAESFSTAQHLDAALSAEDDAAEEYAVQSRAVLLAASGQLDSARRLIDEYPTPDPTDRAGRSYGRFARQLGRWLDAGGPPIPPLHESLSWLVPPAPERPRRPSYADTRRIGEAKREAAAAVLASAKGKSHDEVVALFKIEYANRGLEASSGQIAMAAEMVELDLRPFRRSRRAFRGFQLFSAVGGAGVRHIRHGMQPDPEWMIPPATAAYPLRTSRRYAEVVQNAGARALLDRVAEQSPRRVGPLVPVDLWLAESEGLIVNLGQAVVGTVPPDAAKEFARDLKVARFFAEEIRVPGRLTLGSGRLAPVLEIALPSGHPAQS